MVAASFGKAAGIPGGAIRRTSDARPCRDTRKSTTTWPGKFAGILGLKSLELLVGGKWGRACALHNSKATFGCRHAKGSEVTSRHAITRERLAELAVRRYEGKICLVATAGELERAIAEIGAESVVGLDTETRPAFHRGQYFLPSLVQIAGSQAVYLFELKRRECFGGLAEVLESPTLTKAGIGLRDDFAKLMQVFPFESENVVDLSVVAQQQGIKQSGVRNLAGSLLGFRIPKGPQTSNWSRPRLSPKQIVYAATDAWVCRELYLRFRELGFVEKDN
jgi:hypothetical protein